MYVYHVYTYIATHVDAYVYADTSIFSTSIFLVYFILLDQLLCGLFS